jgi:hypothetical protein
MRARGAAMAGQARRGMGRGRGQLGSQRATVQGTAMRGFASPMQRRAHAHAPQHTPWPVFERRSRKRITSSDRQFPMFPHLLVHLVCCDVLSFFGAQNSPPPMCWANGFWWFGPVPVYPPKRQDAKHQRCRRLADLDGYCLDE